MSRDHVDDGARLPSYWRTRTPCDDCPWRKDAPVRHWHPEEFLGLLRAETAPLGRVYSCHKSVRAPSPLVCAGWLYDQRRRDVPSIALRLAARKEPEAAEALRQVHVRGLKVYRTLRAMCRANGLRVPSLPPDPWRR